jgi:uroporphyrinogen decarboxylase
MKFSVVNHTQRATTACRASATEKANASAASAVAEPFMVRALKGEKVERPPVWMMRQAGRYMKVYQELCKKHTTFRERSENVDLSVEITLQPWRAFKPDGVVLFSDILTPLPAMNIPFDIVAGKGPIIFDPIRTMDQVKEVTTGDNFNYREQNHYVGDALSQLSAELKGTGAAVLGFSGCPFTMATYIVEGGSSKNFTHTKRLMFSNPQVLHALLDKLADNLADYLRYQADSGADCVQIFDSWASQLMPQDYDVFAGPYTQKVIASVRKTHPNLPIILYISGSGGLIERMAASKPDVISIDQSVDMRDAIKRGGTQFAYQGNLDPGILYGDKDTIKKRVNEVAKICNDNGVRHIMNLGHGVLPTTPEENVAAYFEAAQSIKFN